MNIVVSYHFLGPSTILYEDKGELEWLNSVHTKNMCLKRSLKL